MFTLAHLSDLHMASQPRRGELASKRGLGLINWRRKREAIHRPEVLGAITRDLNASHADHIAVTGDLVNFSLPEEYRRSSAWLATIGNAHDVTVVPGNHDVYVREVEQAPAAFWGDYMRGDDGKQRFPFLRQRGDVALIGLSSGVPTGPFMATGRLGTTQLTRFAELLDQTDGQFRVVLIHHPPLSPFRRRLRRLVDGAQLCSVLADKGAELLLHGHDHRRAIVWLDGPHGKKIPAVGVPSASALTRHGEEDEAGYNIFRIDSAAANGALKTWRCEMIGRHRSADGAVRESGRSALF
jgi:3',5'-cyclic AMP phosphodiesterase CpdA